MEVIVRKGWKYTNISIACMEADGTKADPTAISLSVYLVDQNDGTVDAVGSPVTPTKQNAKTGWYGYSLDTSSWDAGQYKLLIEATIDGIDTHWAGDLVITDDIDKFEKSVKDRLAAIWSSMFGRKA